MSRKKHVSAFLGLLLGISFSTFAQTDSLFNALQKFQKEDNPFQVVEAYKNIGRYFESIQEYDSAFSYYRAEGEYIKSHFQDFLQDSLLGKVYMDFSFVALGLRDLDLAMPYLDSAEVVYERIKSYGDLARVMNNRANALNEMNRYEEAIGYLLKAIEYGELVENQVSKDALLNSVYNNIGKNYLSLEDWQNAAKYTKMAIAIPSSYEINNAHARLNLSNAYIGMDSSESAILLAKEAEGIYVQVGFPYGVIAAKNNQGVALKKQGEMDAAASLFQESIDMSEEIEYPLGVLEGLINRSEILAAKKQYSQAISEMKEAERLCNLYDDRQYLKSVRENLASLYEKSGNTANALAYFKSFKQLEDSLKSSENIKNVNDLLLKYETSEKEKQLAEQEVEIQTQKATLAVRNSQLTYLLSGLGILLLGGTFIYQRNRSRQKAALQQAIIEEKERGFDAVIQATEDERKRISKDLHDGIGQQLSALKLGLISLQKKADPEMQSELVEITDRFSKSADEIRQISHQMMPRALMEEGLVQASEDLLRNTFQYSDIRYEFEHHGMDGRLNERIEISIYRVLQELLNNILKHSQASFVNVQLLRMKNKLTLLVEDNGKGLTGEKTSGHGQMNIRNRLDLIKGTVNYESSPESGLVAVITVPVE
ncbi:tetratricopeptide repeat protein [Algoriphagus kandeliae]|uniref:histidine kinase n=1 Tax=Algoriphagus kandeliae TaxID=2562278 RepID=A0A4Y9R1E4_9BACT|nr:sensor histidine kinase [Algoriphagus kandeliae]TFV97126.1 tetratricopeptide repeat protein [Algoriphagus kandeliae]